MPIVFLMSAIVSGIAMVMLVYMILSLLRNEKVDMRCLDKVGLFLLVVNAFLLKLASLLVPGFTVRGFLSAVLGSIVLTILTSVLRYVVF
jgi:uncharacterized membrane protein YvlD (DUF360 family)